MQAVLVTIRDLGGEEASAMRELLAVSELPTEDLADPSITLIGAFASDDELVGVVGLQACDDVGLLRSLAVAAHHRDRGIARRLCERVLQIAAERRWPALWLLTTTASDYFTRLGFEAVPRDEAPAAIRATAQFTSLCPSSAHVMRRLSNSAS